MSAIEYNNLLFEISRRLDELNVLDRLQFMFREELASGSEGIILDALSLFKELEEQNLLGADRLEEMKELLNGVEEWSLLEKVEKFESKRKEYRDLLEQIIRALDELNELERLIAICRGKIPEDSEQIHDVRSLFKELENQNNLGIHRLDILKVILTVMKKDDLFKEVERFEERRKQEAAIKRKKAKAAAFVSSVGNTLTGVLTIKTVFKVVAGGITVVSTMEVLSRWSTFDQLVTAVNTCVLPAGTSLVNLSDGCVCLTVQAETLSALTTLWNLYQDGTLERRLYNFFVTDEVKERAGGETIEVNVSIEEEEYDKACRELMNEARALEAEEIEEGTDELEISQRPKTKLMDPGKLAFVQKYLEDVAETRSMTTNVSDSGLATQTAASELGTEEIHESSKLCLKDLSDDVTHELIGRLQADEAALKKFHQFFGLKMGDWYPFEGGSPLIGEIKRLFPDTTVSVLKECFEALQLYDLVEIMENVKPRSLRPAVSPEQIEKIRRADDRPTKYHSDVAVLVVDYSYKGHIVKREDAEKIETFFKDLNSGNEVSIISSPQETREVVSRIKERSYGLRRYRPDDSLKREDLESILEKELEEVMQMEKELKKGQRWSEDQLILLKQLEQSIRGELENITKTKTEQAKRDTEKLEELKKEIGKPISTALNELIHNQEKFTCVVVFIISNVEWYTAGMRHVVEKLALIPDHTKLVVVPGPGWKSIAEVPETLHVAYGYHLGVPVLTRMIEIFNKRWKTLDLISMMQELKRATFKHSGFSYRDRHNFIEVDSLSSLPKFQKKDD